MEFFDDKQEVMEVILTPFGKHLLSQGRFLPEFYAFFDSDILYDGEWAPGSPGAEVQNDIRGRIQENTPRVKSPSVYTSVETSINIRNELVREAISDMPFDSGSYMAQDTNNHKIYNQETLQQYGDKFEFLQKPLGRSQQSSDYLPAWNISMMKGEISQSADYVTSSLGIVEHVPQLDITLNYKVYVNEAGTEYSWASSNPTVDYGNTTFPVPGDFETTDVSDVFPAATIQDIASVVYEDGTYLSIQNGKILIDITEENVDYKKENFDIQVFVSGSTFDAGPGNPQQLFFASNLTQVGSDDVDKYLTLRMDGDISDPRITKQNLASLNKLSADQFTTEKISTREFLIRDLYDPEEDICD